jgi:hypothetical protein
MELIEWLLKQRMDESDAEEEMEKESQNEGQLLKTEPVG